MYFEPRVTPYYAMQIFYIVEMNMRVIFKSRLIVKMNGHGVYWPSVTRLGLTLYSPLGAANSTVAAG
jgi:hypothetical protein